MAFAKLVPREGMTTRLVAIDPSLIDIETDPDDSEKVIRYIIQYKSVDEDGKEIGKREITEWTPTSDTEMSTGYWMVYYYQTGQSGKWELINSVSWEYDFPPIVHTKNLPNPFQVWGTPDITSDVIELQDRLNFVASNMSKIIRIHAHPKIWGAGNAEAKKIDIGVEQMMWFNDPETKIGQLEQLGDLASSQAFLLNLRQSLFDITRTVDISSIADKIGALTNFGLHVLYVDAVAKLNVKRELYGAFIKEINRRIQILAGIEPAEIEIIWPDPLPENSQEKLTADKMALDMGIVSKQTVSQNNGYDWEVEQDRLGQEKQGEENIGSVLLNAFNRGGGIGNG